MKEVRQFEISLKAFITRGDGVLILRETGEGYWELPGGRIDVGEEWSPRDDVLRRELAEELGPDFDFGVLGMSETWVLKRLDGVFVFLIGHHCLYRGGELRLSHEHSASEWVTTEQLSSFQFPPNSGYPDALRAFMVKLR